MTLDRTTALAPALPPRRERPEIFTRIAPMNRGGDISIGRPPSPRPSPPGRGRTICPPAACTDFRGISPGSWAGGSIVNRGVIILGGVFANMVTSIEGKDSMKREGLRVVSGNRDARKLASLCERMFLIFDAVSQGR